MLRLVDALSGNLVPFERPRGSLVRLCVDPGLPVAPRALRTVVVADVLRRVLEELFDFQVCVMLAQPPHGRDPLPGLAALWVPPPTRVVDSIPEQAAHVVVGPDPPGFTPRGGTSPIWVSVGEVDGPHELSGETADWGGNLPAEWDPLAVRLAFLSIPYGRTMSLHASEARQAEDMLHRWRDDVAAYAECPSEAMPRWIVDRAYSALQNNISTPSLLALVNLLESDARVASGAKFETFVHLDRFLGLDLPGHLGGHG